MRLIEPTELIADDPRLNKAWNKADEAVDELHDTLHFIIRTMGGEDHQIYGALNKLEAHIEKTHELLIELIEAGEIC